MKDLEQLEKKNRESKNANSSPSGLGTPLKKKTPFNLPPSSAERKPVNYEDKIKEL